MEKICVHFNITGHVYGVYYRDATCKKAKQLGLTGRVKNLSDGSVDVIVCGKEEKINLLASWFYVGPAAARVSSVSAEDVEWQEFDDFVIKLS